MNIHDLNHLKHKKIGGEAMRSLNAVPKDDLTDEYHPMNIWNKIDPFHDENDRGYDNCINFGTGTHSICSKQVEERISGSHRNVHTINFHRSTGDDNYALVDSTLVTEDRGENNCDHANGYHTNDDDDSSLSGDGRGNESFRKKVLHEIPIWNDEYEESDDEGGNEKFTITNNDGKAGASICHENISTTKATQSTRPHLLGRLSTSMKSISTIHLSMLRKPIADLQMDLHMELQMESEICSLSQCNTILDDKAGIDPVFEVGELTSWLVPTSPATNETAAKASIEEIKPIAENTQRLLSENIKFCVVSVSVVAFFIFIGGAIIGKLIVQRL